ncbi:MAG: ATP-binding protein [Chthoniobacterales bacterium]|nr:ATP-binding protein [Chthoniobacterales bacterium]
MEIRLKPDFDEIPPAADAVEHFLHEQEAPTEILYLARLVIEELVSNVIKYGYDNPEGHEIRLDVRIEARTMILELSDEGRPFNPLEAPAPDLQLPAEERPIGGLGIHFVRSLSDSVDYHRIGAKNIVTIRKAYPS